MLGGAIPIVLTSRSDSPLQGWLQWLWLSYTIKKGNFFIGINFKFIFNIAFYK